jgi:uncharacterized membrane protein YeaQ/YmgE (transglycosylase-associated protein family)
VRMLVALIVGAVLGFLAAGLMRAAKDRDA